MSTRTTTSMDGLKARRIPNGTAKTHLASGGEDQRGSTRTAEKEDKELPKAVALSLVDYGLVLSLVFGGCCSNVWSYEQLLKMDAHIGTTLTFSQMMFITVQSLPSFLVFSKGRKIPRLQPRYVPLSSWALQVLVLTSGSLLNNWVFAFSVPLTVQIVFRSGGLAVSMLLGYLVLKKRYSSAQVAAVVFVTAGVVLATLSRPSSPKITPEQEPRDIARYTTGVAMLTVSLLLTGILGVLQERTYTKYGPHWKEGVFYTHCLSLPIFLFFASDLERGFRGLSSPASLAGVSKDALGIFAPYIPYAVLVVNMFTQLVCVSGVNQLSSRVSSVSTNLVLTTRKAISLCFSVWWFGNGWNWKLGVGAGMVFLGSLLYTAFPSHTSPPASRGRKGPGRSTTSTNRKAKVA